MACSRAACVFGGARLISSASRSSVKIGPLVSTKLLVWKLNRLVPSTSPGIKSGVNWMRPNLIDSDAANAWASSVFAVPGTPSSRMWPPTRRLVSIRSITSSWPTTALRTSLRIASVRAWISRNSINNLPLPSKYIARERRQRRRAAMAARRKFVRRAQNAPAIDLNGSRLPGPAQPVHQGRIRHPARRMQLARYVADDRVDVAFDDHGLVARKLEQLGRVLDQPGLARRHSNRRRQRDAEATHRGPQQERDGDCPLDGCQDERKLEQHPERRARLLGQTMHGFVEHNIARAPAQPADQRRRKGGIARQSMVLHDVRVGENPQPPLIDAQLADQHALRAPDHRAQPVGLDQLNTASDF